MRKKNILIIMDGWGKGKIYQADAIANANTPFVDNLYINYPNSELVTFGNAVGLPDGQMGNSEVGHLNIGAGRIVYQELERINQAIINASLEQNETLLKAIKYAKDKNVSFHFIGLVSDGGVHSHILHLQALIDICEKNGLENIFIHAFTDGRDTDPHSAEKYISDLEHFLQDKKSTLASISGRYYAMDRDKRWERVKLAYDILVHAEGEKFKTAKDGIARNYAENISDEFIKPFCILNKNQEPIARIKENDVVFCFNFRTDRCREITSVLSQNDMPEQNMSSLPLYFVTMTEYDKNFKNVHVVFHNDDLKNTLGEVLAKHNKSQLRMAETEKYPHVTFFFSGGKEENFKGEKRILKPSPKDVATYDLKPEMSAFDLRDALLEVLEQEDFDFICINFANTDMVGHTGVWEAAIKAAETVDACLSEIIPKALEKNYAIFLTADHGNSDLLKNADGSPNTAHTMNPVPLFFISKNDKRKIKNGKLADLAPSILHYMELSIPDEMTGEILFEN